MLEAGFALLADIHIRNIGEGAVFIIAVLPAVVDELYAAVVISQFIDIAQRMLALAFCIEHEGSNGFLVIRCHAVGKQDGSVVVMRSFHLVEAKLRDALAVAVFKDNLVCRIGEDDTVIALNHLVEQVVQVKSLVHHLAV